MKHTASHDQGSVTGRARVLCGIAAILAVCPLAAAQEEFSITWNTVDCGGGQSNGDEFDVTATIAQPEAGIMTGPDSGEMFSITGGFWIDPSRACYADCDGVGGLTANDFQCFINSFAAGSAYANCDGSTGVPALTANDFQCFINASAAGCR